MKKISAREALSRLQKICSIQEKCIADIQHKLQTWEISEQDGRKIIESLKSDKFVDEERFAVYFVRDKYKINRWGRDKIRYALVHKGITTDIIEAALSEIKEENYNDTLKDLLIKKRTGIKSGNMYEIKGKLIRYGTQKGYGFDIVYKLVEEVMKD